MPITEAEGCRVRVATVASNAMTTLPNRPHTAVLVVDVQNGVVKTAHARDAVVANIAQVVEKARTAQIPVLWVQHTDNNLKRGSEPWQIVPELVPAASEVKLEKQYGDSFEATSLEATLERLAVGHLVVIGAQTPAPSGSAQRDREFLPVLRLLMLSASERRRRLVRLSLTPARRESPSRRVASSTSCA